MPDREQAPLRRGLERHAWSGRIPCDARPAPDPSGWVDEQTLMGSS
jgi:hypothetical protein